MFLEFVLLVLISYKRYSFTKIKVLFLCTMIFYIDLR